MKKEITCKTRLKKNEISKSVFDREVLLCQKLSKDKKGCGWGKCQDCAVIPLLYKLHKGELIEGEKEVRKLKVGILNK